MLNPRRGRQNFCARRWALDRGADGAAGRQDHHRCVGHRASHAVYAGCLSVIACPAQRQSAEAVRRVREILVKVGAEFKSDNVYGLELKNGSRVLALPGSDDSIRGLTVDGWIVADEAARLSDRSDQRVTADAGAPAASAVGHAVDGVEPHRPVLDGLG